MNKACLARGFLMIAVSLSPLACSKNKKSSTDAGTDSGTSNETGGSGAAGKAGSGAAGKAGSGAAGKGTGGSGASGAGGKAGGGGAGGSTAGAGGAGGSGANAPTVTITAPANNASVAATTANPDVPISFSVTNFTLKAPGTCGSTASCGHVHLLIDGSACNDPANNIYNNAGAASPIDAGFDYCPMISGSHTLKIELHNDDHSPVKDAGGTTISDSITVTVPAEADAG